MKKSSWATEEEFGALLRELQPENALVLRVARATGLRLTDVLQLRTAQLHKNSRVTVREQKTGKLRRVYVPAALRLEMLSNAGRLWVFEGRLDWRDHRTRQAVAQDVRAARQRCAEQGKIQPAVVISPHSARKMYAVELYEKSGSVSAVQKKLNHSSADTTLGYIHSKEERKADE